MSRPGAGATGALKTALASAVLAAGAMLAASAGAQGVSTDYAAAPAGTYALDKAHTSVTLKVSHLGLSAYTLRMSGVKGDLIYDPAHPEASRLDVQIDASSVDTGDPAFNRQIADQVLDAAHDPTIRFVSTAIKPGPEGRGQVTGDLTLHGQTHPVTLDVIFNGFAPVPQDHTVRMGFTADATIARRAFGAAAYEPLVGDDVSVLIETEFVK